MIARQSFSSLDKQIDELSKKMNTISSNKYECIRDENGNLIVTFDDGEQFKFPIVPLRNYQERDQKELFVNNKKRIAMQYPRKAGKEIETWSFLISDAIEYSGMHLMLYPNNVRAKKILWQGSISLPGRQSKSFLNMIPERFISKIDNSEMTITLINGSIIWVTGCDTDPDKLRGPNPIAAVISEFAFCDPKALYILLPVFRQNGGWVILQSTFNGNNHFYRIINDNADKKEWFCISESITNLKDDNGDRYITDEMIEEDRQAGMPEYLIQQEYYGNVQINQETRYFAREINYLDDNDMIVEGLFLRNSPVYVAYDLGQNDCTAVIMFQMDYEFNPVIIHYFENNNKDFEFYLYEASRIATRLGLNIHTHFGPHDAVARKGPSTTNYVDYCRDKGDTMIVTRKPFRKIAVIQQMRKMIYRCKFNKENTKRLIDCLSNYEKEYDEKLQRYKDYPLHNWASHGVDSFQTMTLAIDDGLISDGYKEVIYNLN
jgi:hypothetical protein